MGTYLSTPVTEKSTEEGSDLACPTSPVAWGVVDMQGWRKSMEDAHVATSGVPIPPHLLPSNANTTVNDNDPHAKVFGVFDGHGGPEVARFCQLYLVSTLTQQPTWQAPRSDGGDAPDATGSVSPANTNVGLALQGAFHALDRMIDDPQRRTEINRLRAIKPRPGERAEATDIPPPHPNMTVQQLLQQQQQQQRATTAHVMELEPHEDEEEDMPFDEWAASTKEAQNSNPNENNTATEDTTANDMKKQETDPKSETERDSGVILPDTTTTTTDAFVSEKKDDDSDAVVGKEEASRLDQDWMDDVDDDQNKKDPLEQQDTHTNQNGIQSNHNDGENDEEEDDLHIHPSTPHFVREDDETDGDADTEDESSSGGRSGTAGKVSVMFQRLLKMSSNNHHHNHDNGPDASSSETPSLPEAAMEADPSLPGPPTATVTTAPASVLQNGRRVCNLPDHGVHAGATAVVAVIIGDQLTVANAGDSRAVLSRSGIAFPLSFDHKPNSDIESRRIAKAGGFINHFGRVNGNLNLSRSVGDLKYKQVAGIPAPQQMITAQPDLVQVTLLEGSDEEGRAQDEFVLLGCDGIWDCLSNQQAVDYVASRIDTRPPTDIGAELLDEILSTDPRTTQGVGGDNMTLLIVDLQPHKRSYYDGPNRNKTRAPTAPTVSPSSPSSSSHDEATTSSPLLNKKEGDEKGDDDDNEECLVGTENETFSDSPAAMDAAESSLSDGVASASASTTMPSVASQQQSPQSETQESVDVQEVPVPQEGRSLTL